MYCPLLSTDPKSATDWIVIHTVLLCMLRYSRCFYDAKIHIISYGCIKNLLTFVKSEVYLLLLLVKQHSNTGLKDGVKRVLNANHCTKCTMTLLCAKIRVPSELVCYLRDYKSWRKRRKSSIIPHFFHIKRYLLTLFHLNNVPITVFLLYICGRTIII